MMIVVSGRERPEMSGQFDARRVREVILEQRGTQLKGGSLAKRGRAIMRHLDGKAGSAESLGYRLALDHVVLDDKNVAPGIVGQSVSIDGWWVVGMRKCVRK